MRVLLLLLLASAAFGQADAREEEYYSWCRSQGGTPEGSLSTLHCVPPSGGGGQADGAVIPPVTNVKDAIMYGTLKGLSNAMIQGIQEAAARPRAAPVYGRQQAGQDAAVEQSLREHARRRQAEDDAQRQELQGMLVMPDDAAPAPPPRNPIPRPARAAPARSAPVADGGVRVDGSTPLLFTGDPVRDCRLGSPAKRAGLQCLESDAVDVPSPPYLGKDDEVKALAIQKRLVEELDARQQDHDVADMERQAREYLKDEAKSEYEDKGKGYLLGESHGGRPVGVVDSVKDAGLITEHYAQKTLDVFRGEGSSAACVLGSMSPNSCWDTYHENARKLESDTQDLDRQTAAFVVKSYGAKKGWDTARRRLLGGDGAQIFLEAFH